MKQDDAGVASEVSSSAQRVQINYDIGHNNVCFNNPPFAYRTMERLRACEPAGPIMTQYCPSGGPDELLYNSMLASEGIPEFFIRRHWIIDPQGFSLPVMGELDW